ncbi:nucleotidyltransferase domain-containing protein [Desulfonatronum thioautotrophicum]|uniref:nucleotidyltransferase domain-containing protein n=1 Tax=Desulfonatronum thioautotrophicum TaxID=617001 RepID=UPI0005EB4910|nr:nucleotidyltransferase domain-containing protein [Desulfonatronum thioautotrophicum]
MRLNKEQVQIITQVVTRAAGQDARVFLFGSRLDDAARGGDVDLLVETDEKIPRLVHARMKMELEELLGLPVDVLVHARNMEASPFVELARLKGRPIGDQP